MAWKLRTPRTVAFLLLLFATGCTRAPRPIWLEVEGYGLVTPWRKPGEAFQTARETAIQEARVKIWSELLPEKILGDNPSLTTFPLSSAPTAAPETEIGLLPLADDPSSCTWKIPWKTAAITTQESSLYQTTTIEQLAAVSPAFRARLRHMIGNLEPENLPKSAGGRVAVRMRIDRNAVFALARKYLEQQKKL